MNGRNLWISLSLIFSLIWLGLFYHYNNLPGKSLDKYLTPKNNHNPFKNKTMGNTTGRPLIPRLSSKFNEMRALGIPLSMEELLKKGKDPAGNGAEKLKMAFELIHKAGESALFSKLILKGEKPSDEELNKLFNDGQVQEILDLALSVADMEYIDFEIDYSKGPATELPQLGSIRTLIKLMGLKVKAEINSESPESAVNYLNASIKLNDKANDNLTLISSLVEIASYKFIDASLMALRERGFEVDLSKTQSLLEGQFNKSIKDFQKSIDGERFLFGDWMFDKLINNKSEFSNTEIQSMFGEDYSKVASMTNEDLQSEYSEYLKSMVELRINLEDPWYLSQSKIESIPKPQGILNSMIMPAISPSVKRLSEYNTQMKKSLLVLNIDKFKRTHGKFPESVDQLNQHPNFYVDDLTGEKYQIFESEGQKYLGVSDNLDKAVKL